MEFNAMRENGWLDALSDLGRRVILPQGIFYWSGRAKAEADINATIGTATGRAKDIIPDGGDKNITFYIPVVLEKLKQLGAEAVFPYAPILGTPAFRKKWREWIIEKSKPHYPFDASLLGQPMVAPGVSAGLSYTANLFISPGEAIVCPDKRWENYDLMFTGCMDAPIASYRFFEDGRPAPENLEKKLIEVAAKQDKLVTVLNFPNNPTGYMPLKSEAEAWRTAVINAAEKTGKRIIVIFDDAYDGYVFDDNAAQISIFGSFVGAHPNVIPVKADGVSKEFMWYGGRTAAITFAFHPDTKNRESLEKELENKFGALVRGTVSNSPAIVQAAVAAALEEPDRVREERGRIASVLSDRCNKLKKGLGSMDPSAAYADPFNAGFFCLLNVKGADADALAAHILEKHRVGTVPIKDEALGINALRLAFCSVDISQIDELVARVAKGIADMA